jgi:hypothetical protein
MRQEKYILISVGTFLVGLLKEDLEVETHGNQLCDCREGRPNKVMMSGASRQH